MGAAIVEDEEEELIMGVSEGTKRYWRVGESGRESGDVMEIIEGSEN